MIWNIHRSNRANKFNAINLFISFWPPVKVTLDQIRSDQLVSADSIVKKEKEKYLRNAEAAKNGMTSKHEQQQMFSIGAL